jgi:hypothetical protein
MVYKSVMSKVYKSVSGVVGCFWRCFWRCLRKSMLLTKLYGVGKVTIRNDWLRKPSKKQGFRNNVKCINHKKQGFRIDFSQAFVSLLTGLSYHFIKSFHIKFTGPSYRSYRVFVPFLQGYRNV